MPSRRLVCLANSEKLRNRCFAGVCLTEGGKWFRPVDPKNDDAVTEAAMAGCGRTPDVLDIVDVPLLAPAPSNHQTENWLLDTKSPWKLAGKATRKDIAHLVGPEDPLWHDGSSRKGLNDQIPTELAHKQVTDSLRLIQPRKAVFQRQPGYAGKIDSRALFSYAGRDYDLMLTDLAMKATLRAKPPRIELERPVLCVSLTEDFKGHCYKLVAGVIP